MLLDGKPLLALRVAGSGQIALALSGLPPGSHTLTLIQTDPAGNTSGPRELTFFVRP